MDKPQRRVFEDRYDYNKIEAYIEWKYKIQFRGYQQEERGVYLDFWHVLLRVCQIARGTFVRLPEADSYVDDWACDILNLIYTEFPELRTEPVWVDW